MILIFHDDIDDVKNWVEMTDVYNPKVANDSDETRTKAVLAASWTCL
jgi:hypothetical protein